MNAPTHAPVAVVDLGSNSIKLLVARRNARGEVVPLHTRTIDARIGAGMARADPVLGEAGMAAAITAVATLLAEAAPHQCGEVAVVATSAVRDARNGGVFAAKLEAATGHTLRILSGAEEANLIGRGLTADPALADQRDFYVFDLGGGSLECLAFRERRIVQAVSVQLGCVRLTEQFVSHPQLPFPTGIRTAVENHVVESVRGAGFDFPLTRPACAIGTGGTVTTARSMLAARAGRTFAETSADLSITQLRGIFEQLLPLTLEERCRVPGLPATRADVFPIALLTLLTLAEVGGFSVYRNSLYNLRYGLAAEMLP